MPTTDLTIPNDINVSVQIGDIIYYTPTTLNGIHNTAGTIVELGPAVAIIGNMIRVNHTNGAQLPGNGDFIMFAKRRSTNIITFFNDYLLLPYTSVPTLNNSDFSLELFTNFVLA